MKASKVRSIAALLLLAVLVSGLAGAAGAQDPTGEGASTEMAAPQDAVTTAFTYQGMLKKAGAPFNGVCEFRFTAYGQAIGGYWLGAPIVRSAEVKGGLFTVTDVAFGPDMYQGDRRWVEVAVRCSLLEDFTVLGPRQELTAVPYALGLRPGAHVLGAVASFPYAALSAQNTATQGDEPLDGIRGVAGHPKGAGVSGTGLGTKGVGVTGISLGESGAGVLGQSTGNSSAAVLGKSYGGLGGLFESQRRHALVTLGPTLMGGRNPQQIAMLRWYGVNWVGYSIPVESRPDQMIFDGQFIWVTNYGSDGKVTKIRASDGAVYGPYLAGSYPNSLTFDGLYVWIGSENPSLGNNTVIKMRATDGLIVKTLTIFNSPGLVNSRHWGMAFDGNWVWVTNLDDDSVTKIWAIGDAVVGSYPTGDQPHGVIFDGTSIWVANKGSNNVTKIRPADGYVEATCPTEGTEPFGLATDGANIWVTGRNPYDSSQGLLTVLRAADCQILASYAVAGNPVFLAFDGYYMWVTHYRSSGLITRLRAYDGFYTPDDMVSVHAYPLGIAFDGANIWVAESEHNSVSKH